MILRTLALGLLFSTAWFGLARTSVAWADSIGDCEKIQAADAYNQCLAKFGPTSKLRNLEPERPGDVKASGADAAAAAQPLSRGRSARGRHGGGRRHFGGGGRQRVQFSISRRRHR